MASPFLIICHWQALDKDVLELAVATELHIKTLMEFSWLIRSWISKDKKHLPILEWHISLSDSLFANVLPYKPHLVTAMDIDQWMDAKMQK
jgi:hypothetical protein